MCERTGEVRGREAAHSEPLRHAALRPESQRVDGEQRQLRCGGGWVRALGPPAHSEHCEHHELGDERPIDGSRPNGIVITRDAGDPGADHAAPDEGGDGESSVYD